MKTHKKIQSSRSFEARFEAAGARQLRCTSVVHIVLRHGGQDVSAFFDSALPRTHRLSPLFLKQFRGEVKPRPPSESVQAEFQVRPTKFNHSKT